MCKGHLFSLHTLTTTAVQKLGLCLYLLLHASHMLCLCLWSIATTQPKPDVTPAQPWRPRTPHTCWVLTRKRTPWRALAEELTWVWAQGELGVLSVVRLGRCSWVPLSWASWWRYSSLRWRPSWRESRDWSCNRSMEPSRIMESEGGRKRERMMDILFR